MSATNDVVLYADCSECENRASCKSESTNSNWQRKTGVTNPDFLGCFANI